MCKLKPSGLKCTVEFEISKHGASLWLEPKLATGNKDSIIGFDAFPDNELGRDKLQYMLNYMTRRLEEEIEDISVKVFSESAFAAEWAKGGPKSAEEIAVVLKAWAKQLPSRAVKNLTPAKKLGRRSTLDREAMNNVDLTFENAQDEFRKAKSVIQTCKKLPLLDDWQKIFPWPPGDERFTFAEKFALPKPRSGEPPNSVRQVTLAYLANQTGLSTGYLEKAISKAKKSRAALKEPSPTKQNSDIKPT